MEAYTDFAVFLYREQHDIINAFNSKIVAYVIICIHLQVGKGGGVKKKSRQMEI